MDFIDIRGASGTAYRFRRWPQTGVHPPIAGNIVLVAAGTRKLIEVGMLDDLSQAPFVLAERLTGADLFTRFNVSRANRESEHADMALQHPEVAHPATADAASQVA